MKAPDHKKVNPIFFDGFNLSDYLITFYGSAHISSHKPQDMFKKRIKELLWSLSYFGTISFGGSEFKKNRILSSNSNFKKKYLFVSNYPDSHRAFPVLNNLISEVTNKREILIVTDSKSVFNYYTSENIACIYLKVSSICFDKYIWNFKHLKAEESFILSKVKKYISFSKKLIDEYKPEVTLTVCDLHLLERVFTESSQLKNIPTITHQHGQMAPTNRMFDYTISDYLVVWGEKTKRDFVDQIKKTEIKVIGTDIHNHYLASKSKKLKNYLTLAVNPRSDELNHFLLKKIPKLLSEMEATEQEKYIFVLKLHPSMNQEYWKDYFLKSIYKDDFKMNYEIHTDNNELVLKKSKILMLVSSSIALEAFMTETSVICLDIPELYNNPFVYYDNLPESKVYINDLFVELNRRLSDDEYNQEILKKQMIALGDHISDFESSKKELEWIDDIICERE
jgi:hypothetical protein